MYREKKTLPERYVSFLGSWTAGTLMGHVIGKILFYCFIIWLISKYVCAG